MAGDDADLVQVVRSGLTAELVLNRPAKLNALNDELIEQLARSLQALEDDDSVSVIVVRGEGRAFSVGFDITATDHSSPASAAETAYDDWRTLRRSIKEWLRIWDLDKPVIAAVHGYCMGGATAMVACADLTIVAEDAVIGWPSVPLGGGLLSPVSMWLIGPKKAKELSYIAGSALSGTEAAQCGWANYAVPTDSLLAQARDLAERVSRTPLDLLRLKKRALNRVMDLQGFRESVQFGAEWDAISHTSAAVLDMQRQIAEVGLRPTMEQFRADPSTT